MTGKLTVRPADLNRPDEDILNIWNLLAVYAEDKLLLPRTQDDIREKLGNFRIAEINGKFVGCCALRDYGNDLYEIRSLAIQKEFAGMHVGSKIVQGIIEQMQTAGHSVRLFALTYRDHFFRNLGFRIVEKTMFPDKIWSDCSICSKFHQCDEIAVLLELNCHDGINTTQEK